MKIKIVQQIPAEKEPQTTYLKELPSGEFELYQTDDNRELRRLHTRGQGAGKQISEIRFLPNANANLTGLRVTFSDGTHIDSSQTAIIHRATPEIIYSNSEKNVIRHRNRFGDGNLYTTSSPFNIAQCLGLIEVNAPQTLSADTVNRVLVVRNSRDSRNLSLQNYRVNDWAIIINHSGTGVMVDGDPISPGAVGIAVKLSNRTRFFSFALTIEDVLLEVERLLDRRGTNVPQESIFGQPPRNGDLQRDSQGIYMWENGRKRYLQWR